jgi:hypothetical protein
MSTWTSVVDDDFTAHAGTDVDRSIWVSPHWTANSHASFLGRTGIRNPKDFSADHPSYAYVPVSPTGGAQLRLGEYNPLAAGASLLGSVFTPRRPRVVMARSINGKL